MADIPGITVPGADAKVDVAGITGLVLQELAKHISLDSVADAVVNAAVRAVVTIAKTVATVATPIAQIGGKALVDLEEPMLPVLAAFVAPIVANLFGTDVPAGAFDSRDNRESRGTAARAIVESFMSALTGEGESQAEPSDAGAKRIAGAAVHAVLEGWFNELIPEMLGELIPIDWMHFPAFTGLSEEVISALGVSRLVRRAFAPLIDATAATPMKWKVEKTYRTQLLAAGTVAKQLARGRITREQAFEELARQGYSDERIEAVLNEAAKFHSVADVALLIRSRQWSKAQGVQHLQDQGYEQAVADLELTIEEIKAIAAYERELAGVAVDAYAAGRIGDAQLRDYTEGAMLSDTEGNRFRELASGRRALRNVPLSPSEAETCVKAGILAVADYRHALETAGRSPEAIDALELLLRKALNDKAHVDELRKQQDADKAAAAKLKADTAAAREADVAARQALARRGALTDLKHAVVTGIIPISRYEEVLAANYDGDTVQILVDQVEQDRAAFVAQQAQRDAAAKRADNAGLSTAQLEAAVLADVITPDQYRASLQAKGVAGADVDVLTATLAARKADQDKAKQTRDEAAAAAKRKNIDLGRADQLVRAGVWTMARYDDLLASLGYDEPARASLEQLLRKHVDEDAAAAKARAEIFASNAPKGISLEQARRAVILEIATLDDFERFLQDHNYTLDAQRVLIGELRDDVAAADAARLKRDQAENATGPRTIPLATVTKAASLGLVSTDAYRDRLVEAGYSDDDVALEMELLAAQIADVQSARAKQVTADVGAKASGLTLAQLAAAVKVGAASLADYQARARVLGLSQGDATILVRVLGDEIATTKAAKVRHDEIAGELTAASFSLADLDNQARAGALTLEDYAALLTSKGYAPDDVELLAGLLEEEINQGAPPA